MLDERLIGGRYRLGPELGGGGMGTVYEATDLATDTLVALKLLRSERLATSPHASRRFQREARVIGALSVPHIVRLFDAGHDVARDTPYLVMERLRGRDLKQCLDELGPLPSMLVVRIAAHAALGLRAAHATGIVHRDIKPANLFLATDPDLGGAAMVKVLDFGISKFDKTALHTENTSVSVEGSMIGSPAYMSPEQARGESDVDARTDIWSLGVVMYEALTGHLPFGENVPLGQVILAICSQPPRPIASFAPSVPPALASIVHRALAKSRDERWQSVDELLSALRELDGACAEAIAPALFEIERRSSAPPSAILPVSYARATATDRRTGAPSDDVAVVLGEEQGVRRRRRRRLATAGLAIALGAPLVWAFVLGRPAPIATSDARPLRSGVVLGGSAPLVRTSDRVDTRRYEAELGAEREAMGSAVIPVASGADARSDDSPVAPGPRVPPRGFDAGRASPGVPSTSGARRGPRAPVPPRSASIEDVYAP